MVSLQPHYLLYFNLYPLASKGLLYYHMTEKEKTHSWVTESSVGYASIIQKLKAVAPLSLSGISMESSEGKSSQGAAFQKVLLVVHFAWKEKWSDE